MTKIHLWWIMYVYIDVIPYLLWNVLIADVEDAAILIKQNRCLRKVMYCFSEMSFYLIQKYL